MHHASNQKCSKIVWAVMTNLVLSLKMTVIILYELTNHHHHGSLLFEGSLEVKQRWEEQRGEEKKKEDQRRERMRRKKMQAREKGRKVAKHCVLPMICDSGGPTSRLAKAAGAEPSGEMREEKLHAVVARCTFRSQSAQKPHMFGTLLEVESSKKCTPLWREAHFKVKSVKN